MWPCSRNDAIGNLAVPIASDLVFLINFRVSDLVVVGMMTALFPNSAYQVASRRWRRWRQARADIGRKQHDRGGSDR